MPVAASEESDMLAKSVERQTFYKLDTISRIITSKIAQFAVLSTGRCLFYWFTWTVNMCSKSIFCRNGDVAAVNSS